MPFPACPSKTGLPRSKVSHRNSRPNWLPKDAAEELQSFIVSIGSEGSEGADLFEVAVATCRGLKARRGRKRKFVGLVVNEFTPVSIEKAIRGHVASVQATTWEAVAQALGPVMKWEYAGYK